MVNQPDSPTATPAGIPSELVFARTTPVFDAGSVPSGLKRAHKVAAGVWGHIVVESGTIGFFFEDSVGGPIDIEAGEAMVIPPNDPHHVVVPEGATFRVEFYGPPK